MDKIFWVICGNDYPAGELYSTEQAASDRCTELNIGNKEAVRRASMRGNPTSRIYYHYHQVELKDGQA